MSITTPSDDPQFISALSVEQTVTSSNTQDEAWATVPLEDDPTPPDTAGYTLVSDVADFARPLPALEPTSGDSTASGLLYGRDLDFDFDSGEPTGMEYGSVSYAEDDEQVLQWIAKALDTPKGRYQIYPATYGSQLYWLTGATGPDQTIFSEVSRTVSDVLLAHPRVRQALVDGVFREPLAAAAGLFVSARIWLDNSDEATPLVIAAGS